MKKERKRSKKSAIVAISMAAALLITGALAFMSDNDNAINKFNFTNSNGDQSVDVQLSETNWDETNGVDIQYGTPVAKNPVATNIGTNDMYAFATVILPAKGVVVQNKDGEVVGVDGQAIKGNAFNNKFVTSITSNVSTGDKEADDDQTEILGVFKDAALANEYEFGEVIDADRTDNTEVTVYFKLNATSPYGVAKKADGTDWVAVEDPTTHEVTNAADIAYRVLEDTVDEDNYTSNTLGHQFMLKVEPKDGVDLEVRELYTLEKIKSGDNLDSKDPANADRIKDGAWVHYDNVPTAAAADADAAYENAAGTVDGSANALNVYGRSAYHNGTGEWVEITDSVAQKTVYIDGAGRIYSAHVFYYTAPLAPEASTVPVFDYVELINVTNGQILEEDDMDIYVETYGLQTTGVGDALEGKTGNVAQGAALWQVLTNSENQEGFDIFGVVKDAQDTTVADYVAHGQNVANDYAVTINP